MDLEAEARREFAAGVARYANLDAAQIEEQITRFHNMQGLYLDITDRLAVIKHEVEVIEGLCDDLAVYFNAERAS